MNDTNDTEETVEKAEHEGAPVGTPVECEGQAGQVVGEEADGRVRVLCFDRDGNSAVRIVKFEDLVVR